MQYQQHHPRSRAHRSGETHPWNNCAGAFASFSEKSVRPTFMQMMIRNEFDLQVIADKVETISGVLARAIKLEGATGDDLERYLGHTLSQLNRK